MKMKKEFKETCQMTDDHLSRAHKTIQNQVLVIANYVSRVEELE